MVDKFNLPEGYTLIDDTEEELLEEEIVEDVPKDKDVQICSYHSRITSRL